MAILASVMTPVKNYNLPFIQNMVFINMALYGKLIFFF